MKASADRVVPGVRVEATGPPDAVAQAVPKGQSLAHVIRADDGQTRVVFDPPSAVLAVPNAALDPEAVPPVFEAPTHLVVWHPILAGALVGWVRVDYSTQSLEQ